MKKDKLKLGLKDSLFILIFLILLFVLSQLTRFENEIIISYDGAIFTAKIQNANLTILEPNLQLNKITASFQKATLSESGLSLLRIEDENNKQVYEIKRFVVNIFGKDLFNNMIKGKTYMPFSKTFGDWWSDRFFTYDVLIYNNTLPSKFHIDAVIVGRGSSKLNFFLNETSKITISVADGFYDNAFFVYGSNSTGTYSGKKASINLLRILNLFIESTFAAILLIFIISLISNENIFRGNLP